MMPAPGVSRPSPSLVPGGPATRGPARLFAPFPVSLRASLMTASSPSFWRDRSVFVTGSTGFLGSALTEQLVRQGARVVALVRDHVADSALARSGTLSKIGVVYGRLEDADT